MPFQVDHVALLVPSLTKAIAALGEFPNQPIARFQAEGTAECYIGSEGPSRLLLVEAEKPGPYASALEKRGPGLHHIAVNVLDKKTLLETIQGTGWLLHPASLTSLPKTVWLCRPGIPFLVEVHLGATNKPGPPFVERLELAMPVEIMTTVSFLFAGFCLRTVRPESRIFVGGRPFGLDVLLR